MPHSLRVRLKNLERKGELEKKDVNRIIEALDYMDNIEKHDRELFNKFKTEHPDLEVEDYRPFYLDSFDNWKGITIWLKNGDILLYFPLIEKDS